jgi:hypothetical protein
MANHQEWQDLTIIEKIDLVGKITHLLQNDIISYQVFKTHIKLIELAGLFDEVKINTTNEGNS